MKKKIKVLMLPTEKASNTDIMPGKLCTSPRYNNGKQPLIFGEFENSYFNECVPQHLYLVSEDEEIKEGDWFINIQLNKLCQAHQSGLEYDLDSNKKIIATTNKSLLTRCDCSKLQNVCTSINGCKELPRIPESFVEAFVKADGKINEVMVECEQKRFSTFTEGQIGEDSNTFYENILKTREDNTVIIHKVKSDKQYTLEDIKKTLFKFMIDINNSNQNYIRVEFFNEWVEKNLK